VIYWLQSRDIEPDDALVEKLFEAAKNSNRVLPEKTVWAMVKEYQGKGKDGEANRTAEGK
jgi:hypothetical protein